MSSTSEPKAAASPAPILVDFGKHRRKQVKQLAEGRGPLMAEVTSCLEELKAAGTVGADATPVIVVVRQKPRRRAAWPLG